MPDPVPVSVVIPTHDRADLIGRAIGSVLAQTAPPTEVIVVDDGSNDETAAAVDAVGNDTVRFLRHPHRLGASAARNTGIDAATAPFVAFLDSDDEWLPTKLERQLAVFGADGDGTVGLVHCAMEIRSPRGSELIDGASLTGHCFERLLALPRMPGTPTFVVRRAVLDDGARFDDALESHQDRDFALTVASRWRLETVATALVVVHQDPARARVFSGPSAASGGLRLLDKWHDHLVDVPRAHATATARVAEVCLATGDRRTARHLIARSLRARPGLRGARSALIWAAGPLAPHLRAARARRRE